jgi:hypothetical protein
MSFYLSDHVALFIFVFFSFFRGLRKLIEPILAALFEINTARAMTFDQYFIAVNDVIQMKTLKVFCAQTGTQTILYLHKTDW